MLLNYLIRKVFVMFSTKLPFKLISFSIILTTIIVVIISCSSADNATNNDDIGGVTTVTVQADHDVINDFASIPSAIVEKIGDSLVIFYGHTSHGSQIMSGLDLVESENSSYTQPTCHEISDDLGHNGDISWVQPTRSWLDSHPDYNVVMWSWCGGCTDNTEVGINTYLSAMNQLESDYSGVAFIYMTGHLDGSGVDGNLYARNNQIREYCTVNNKILFDFADIESYDPAGNYYPDADDGCDWCSDWCTVYECESCGCAHSHCFNCYLKGKAFWWLMARLVGWEG
jgi:hypothetical protein